ncbi:DUF2303 family protein [Gallibacterium sp. AGMB14963]|uniref:DUF2303 family protein n=1 Tax=Gallibacterium faecale TaxID=3019086 RepID=UPI0022F1A222|nr:DUF2303 family protein [Gallibacterium sp. AGMB14963]MDA3979018.1 DUF2303 family protein [Gallibacterium sp. AGMB14963]
MEQTNLEQIKDLVLSSVHIGNSDYPVAILPKDVNIVSLEKHNQFRNQFRAKFSTANFDSLVAYAKLHNQDNAKCFIDEQNLSAEIIFDVGTLEQPLHATHRALLNMQKTAAYSALLDFQGRRHDQRAFSEWLEDWGDFITPYTDDEEKMSITNAVQAVRKITLDYARNEEHEVSDFATSKSAMERVEAKSKLQMPKYFVFNTETYKGLSCQAFTLRLSILTGGDYPILVARLIKMEQIQEAIAKEFSDKLTNALNGTGITVNIGEIDI